MVSRQGNRVGTVRSILVCGVRPTWHKFVGLDFPSGFFSSVHPLCLLTQMPAVNSKVRYREGPKAGPGQAGQPFRLPGPQEKPSAHANFLKSNGSQNAIPRPSASPRNLSEMHIFRLYPSAAKSAVCILTFLPDDSDVGDEHSRTTTYGLSSSYKDFSYL